MEKTLRNQAETEKGSDLRRQCEATVGKSGKPCASRAVPKSPQNPRICPCSQRGISRSPLMITLKCALALPADTPAGLRDRALLALLAFSACRVEELTKI